MTGWLWVQAKRRDEHRSFAYITHIVMIRSWFQNEQSFPLLWCHVFVCTENELAWLTGQSVALWLILVPLTVEIQRAALAVGKLAAHLLVPHRTVGEVLHVLQRERGEEIRERLAQALNLRLIRKFWTRKVSEYYIFQKKKKKVLLILWWLNWEKHLHCS